MTSIVRSGVTSWLTALSAVVAVSLSIPPLRSTIEQSMAWHMVFQMPLLVLSGWLAAQSILPRYVSGYLPQHLTRYWSRINHFGLTGLMAAQAIVAYWMLPLAIDRAVVLPQVDAVKILTLFLGGGLLADGFRRAPMVLQLFFMGYWVPMMAWLGIYLATTDLRVCNAYSLQTQVQTGWGLLVLGAALGATWVAHGVANGVARGVATKIKQVG